MKYFGIVAVCLTAFAGATWGADTEAFFAAVRAGRSDRVEQMIAKDKMLVFTTNRQGLTPFLIAVENRDVKMAALLADYFARLNDTAGPGNAFHIAAANNDDAMVRLLLQLMNEEDPALPRHMLNMPRLPTNSATNDRNTPLHLAAQNCNRPLYRLLVANGAQPGLRNAAGKTPAQLLQACPPEKKAAAAKPAPARKPAAKPKPAAYEPITFPIE